MRKLFFAVLSVVVLANINFQGYAQEGKPADKVVAYYFHGSFRCQTCTNMEKYSREAIEMNFKEAVASGALSFMAVNVEERGNEHFTDDYQLYTKALILSFVKDGKEVRHKNLDKIWEYAHNKKKFTDYLTGEIDNFLKEVPQWK